MKAFQFFYEVFIKKLEVATSGEFTYLNVRMEASMKSTLYKIVIKLCSSSGDVYLATCTCPAGTGVGGNGNFNHVGGVLFALEDLNRNGFQDLLTPIFCTSKLSAWNVPRDSSSDPVPIDAVIIEKIKFGRNNGKEYKPKKNVYDPRAPFDR